MTKRRVWPNSAIEARDLSAEKALQISRLNRQLHEAIARGDGMTALRVSAQIAELSLEIAMILQQAGAPVEISS